MLILLFICNGIVVHVQLNVFQISSKHLRGKKTKSLVRRDEPSFYMYYIRYAKNVHSLSKKMTFIYPTKTRHFSLCRNDELLSYFTSMVILRKGATGL